MLVFALAPMAHAQSTSAATQTQTQYAPPSCTMQVSPATITKGGSVTVVWRSQNAVSASITGIGTNLAVNNQANLIPLQSTRYVGTFVGADGKTKVNCDAVVTVLLNGVEVGGAGGTVGEYVPATTPKTNQNNGLVPCNGTDCQACHVAKLGQNIINFLMGLSIPIAAAMFAWAGILFFSSSVVNNISKARSIFTTTTIGFLLIIGAWLGVETLLKTVLAPQFYQNWHTIKCVDDEERPMNKTVGQLLSVLPGLNTTPIQVSQNSVTYNGGGQGTDFNQYAGRNAYSCASGYSLSSFEGSTSCVKYGSDGDVEDIQEPACTNGGDINQEGQCTDINGNIALIPSDTLYPVDSAASTGLCNPDSIAAAGLPSYYSCIFKEESGCSNAPKGCYDTSADGNCFSVSGAQINLTKNAVSCGGQTLDCPSAWSCPSSGTAAGNQCVKYLGGQCLRAAAGYGCTLRDPVLYQSCVQALDTQCALQAAAALNNTQGVKNAYRISAAKCGL